MNFIFTANKGPISRLIRWGLEEPCSHFAIAFENNILCHQTFSGFAIDWYPHWYKSQRIWKRLIPMKSNIMIERKIMGMVADKWAGSGYDISGFAYFSWRALLFKAIEKDFPETNKWGTGPDTICTGIAQDIKAEFPHYFSDDHEDFEILSPHKLYLSMIKSGAFAEV